MELTTWTRMSMLPGSPKMACESVSADYAKAVCSATEAVGTHKTMQVSWPRRRWGHEAKAVCLTRKRVDQLYVIVVVP